MTEEGGRAEKEMTAKDQMLTFKINKSEKEGKMLSVSPLTPQYCGNSGKDPL